MFYNILMDKEFDVPVVDSTEDELMREGYLRGGLIDLTDEVQEEQIRRRIRAWRSHNYQVVCIIVGDRRQFFRKK